MDGPLIEALLQWGYLILFAWVLGEQLGLPLPAEPMLLASGALAATGRLRIGAVILLAALASLLADTVWYWIGRWQGTRVLGWLCRISMEPDSCVRKTEQLFMKHGAPSLLVAKFIPGYNTAAPPLAGVVGMSLSRFLRFSAGGALIWAGVFIGIGHMFSAQLELVGEYFEELGSWALGLAIVALGAHIAWKFISRQRFLRRIRIARITPEELKARLDDGDDTMIVDVRDRIDFDAEPHVIPGALHLTTEELAKRHREIPRGRDIVLYCT
jgi:membrane protein DedA with SNARE-associated domain